MAAWLASLGAQRVSVVARAGELDSDFKGFHRLERALYRDGVTDAESELPLSRQTLQEWAEDLEKSYTQLGRRIAAVRRQAACAL